MEPTTKITDTELKDQGATLKFGIDQLNNKTPAWVSQIANAVIFAGMVWGLISMGLSSVPDDIKLMINEWVLLSSGIIKLASKFFGFQLPQNN